MGWNIKQVDDNTLRITDDESSEPAFELGRGTTDTDVVYIALRNTDGELAYIFPDALQTSIVVQATKP